jgi:hypothetical protein
MAADATQSENRSEPRFWSWLLTKPVTLGFAGVIVLLTVFYIEEDLRGKLAWQRYRRQLKGGGQVLDWDILVPTLVPEAENVFRAPRMKNWFVFGGINDLSLRTNKVSLANFLNVHASGKLAEIKVIPIGTNFAVNATQADIVLRYGVPELKLVRGGPDGLHVKEPQPEIIPLIVMDQVPFADAVRHLANRAGIKYSFSPEVAEEYVRNGNPQPTVTIRWENVTARQALGSLLNNYGLMVENPKASIAVIKANVRSRPKIYVDADAGEELKRLVHKAVSANEASYCNGPQGIKLFARAPSTKPFHIVLQADQIPSPREAKQFLPPEAFHGLPFDGNHLEVNYDGTNSFSISLGGQIAGAADYLAWNDRFCPDFDLMRQALKRPSVRIDGDYSQPFSQPRFDYGTIRIVAQTLAQSAQCYLLLGEPEKALHELTLLHDMNRLMEAKPVTLVAAMIEVAITGIYTDVIADGFRLGAWREPQLLALQAQLAEVNLPPQLRSAFLTERAGLCRVLESQNAAKVHQSLTFPPTTQSLWQRLQDPQMLLASVAPRGWNQQNMVVVAKLDQMYLDSFDAERQIFSPRRLDAIARDVQKTFNRVTPMNFLAAISVPNFTRAFQTVAQNQTSVNQANVACALERYRAANGDFPETLALLVPGFIQKLPVDLIGGQPLHYRRKSSDNFLLYSVGWNETDDAGVSVPRENGYVDPNKGDWPWNPLQEKK